MVFKSKVGVTFYIVLLLQVVMTVAFIVLAIVLGPVWTTWIFAIAAVFCAAVFFLFCIPAVKDTAYTITDDYLLVKTGWYELELPYTDIIEITPNITSIIMEPALSFKRVEIKYKTPRGMREIVHVSPVNEKEFVLLLESQVRGDL